MSPDAEALKRIVFSRVSMKSFQTKAIPEEVLKAILSVTQVGAVIGMRYRFTGVVDV